MSQINVELGFGSTVAISLNDTNVRTLLGKASGAISLSDGYGKSNAFAFTISANIADANLRTLAVNAGWNQTSKVVATINSGVYVYSTNTANAGLTINGAFPGGVELINNGFIMGKGGKGGFSYTLGIILGGVGGPAINLGVNVSITNNSYIAGGGGGGSGYTYFQSNDSNTYPSAGGGGAGGGDGDGLTTFFGLGGAPGVAGGNASYANSGSGGGGRILPGTGGAGYVRNSGVAAKGGGAGGGGDNYEDSFGGLGTAGGGGGWGAAGGGGNSGFNGGNGGAGSDTGKNGSGVGGGGAAGGKAVNLNGFVVTWLAVGTRYGVIS